MRGVVLDCKRQEIILLWVIHEVEVAVGCRGGGCCKWVGGNPCVNWGLTLWGLGSPPLEFLFGVNAAAQPRACSQPLLMSCTAVPAVSIDSIQEVCEGKQSEIFQRYADGSFDPNCCFSIYYGDHMESLDLVSSSAEEARTWITGLKYLMAGISDEDSLSKRQRTRDQYPSCAAWECSKHCRAMNKLRIPYSICFATSEH